MRIKHGRVSLALHAIASGSGVPLLLLHGLFGSAEDWGPAAGVDPAGSACGPEPSADGPLPVGSLRSAKADRLLAAWQGPVYALDFSGHGKSDWVTGGAYCPELLLGDADIALAHIGSAALAGAGLGAYVAVLLAGARADAVRGALLLPGAGLDGAGDLPDFTQACAGFDVSLPDEPANGRHDPMVRGLETSPRPAAYVQPFADAAAHVLLLEDAGPRPSWWQAARRSPAARIVPGDPANALSSLAAVTRR